MDQDIGDLVEVLVYLVAVTEIMGMVVLLETLEPMIALDHHGLMVESRFLNA